MKPLVSTSWAVGYDPDGIEGRGWQGLPEYKDTDPGMDTGGSETISFWATKESPEGIVVSPSESSWAPLESMEGAGTCRETISHWPQICTPLQQNIWHCLLHAIAKASICKCPQCWKTSLPVFSGNWLLWYCCKISGQSFSSDMLLIFGAPKELPAVWGSWCA